MAVINPYAPTLATNRKEILNKLKFILETFLDEEIQEYNTRHNLTGENALIYPRTINFSINSMDLANGTDQFPALNVIAGGSTTTPDNFLGTQTDIVDYDIISAVVCDNADINFNTEQAQALSLIAANCIEKRLPDSPGIGDGTTCFRVDQTASTAGRPTQFNNGLWLLYQTSRLKVYSRAQTNYNPAYLSASFDIKPYVESNFVFSGNAVWRADGSPLGVAQENKMAALSVPAASTTWDFYVSGSNVPSGSNAMVTIQRDLKMVEQNNLPFLSGEQIISISPDTPLQNDDVWTVSLTISGTNNFLTFPARITLV